MSEGLDEARDPREVEEFFRAAWGEDPNAARPETIRWRYRHGADDPARRGVHFVWRDAGKIVAHIGLVPERVLRGEEEIDAAWLLDWLVLKSFRGARVGTRLMKAAVARHALSLAVGLTYDSELIFRRARWFDLGLVKSLGRIEDGGAYLRARWPTVGKIPGAALLARALFARRRKSARRADGIEIRIGDGPPGGIAFDREGALARIPRDERYLPLKYHGAPWPITHVTAWRGGAVAGWSAWSLKTRGDGLKVGMLLDLESPDAETIAALLRTGIGAMQDSGAELLIVQHRNMIGDELLSRFGFLPRAGLRLMGYWRDDPSGAPEELKNPDGWLIRGGDSDMDR